MKINLEIFKMLSIFSVGFFLPWGANFVEVGGYPPLYLIISTFILAMFLFSTGLSIQPAFRLFFLFVLCHIVLTIIIFGGDYLFLEHIQSRSIGPRAVYLTSDSNIKLIEKILFLFFFFFVLCSVIKKRSDWLVLAISFLVGLGVVCLLKLKFALSVFPDIRFSGAYDDPNAFGIAACLAFFLTILLFDNAKIFLLKAVLILALIFFSVMLLLSESRGALVSLFCAFFVMLKEKKLALYKLVSVAAIFLTISYFVWPLIPDRFLSPESWIEDRGSNRLDIWMIYLTNIWSYFLTGVGFARTADAISTGILGHEYISHNVFLETLVEFGIFGLFFLGFVLRELWLKLRSFPSSSPDKAALKAIFISWVVGAFFISAFSLRETWLMFVLIATSPVLYLDHRDP